VTSMSVSETGLRRWDGSHLFQSSRKKGRGKKKRKKKCEERKGGRISKIIRKSQAYQPRLIHLGCGLWGERSLDA